MIEECYLTIFESFLKLDLEKSAGDVIETKNNEFI